MIREPLTPTHAAIAAYLAWSADRMFMPPPTVAQVRLIAEYCQEYINQYTYPQDAITYLRRRVVQIRTLDDLEDWLWDCRKFAGSPLGAEPL